MFKKKFKFGIINMVIVMQDKLRILLEQISLDSSLSVFFLVMEN